MHSELWLQAMPASQWSLPARQFGTESVAVAQPAVRSEPSYELIYRCISIIQHSSIPNIVSRSRSMLWKSKKLCKDAQHYQYPNWIGKLHFVNMWIHSILQYHAGTSTYMKALVSSIHISIHDIHEYNTLTHMGGKSWEHRKYLHIPVRHAVTWCSFIPSILSILSILFAPAKLWAPSSVGWPAEQDPGVGWSIYGDSHSLQGAYAATCHMSWFDSAKHVSLEFVLHETIEVRTASCLHGCLLPRFWSLTSHFTQVWRPKQSFLAILWGLHTMKTSVWTFSSKLLLEYDRMNIVRRSIRTAIKFWLLQKKPRRTEYLEAKLRRPHRIWWHTMSYINI